MAKTNYASVDAYIAAQPESIRPVLERVRGLIRKAMPAAEEAISYQIPTYKLNGRAVLFFAGWKEHFSLYPTTAPLLAAFPEELSRYSVAKGTIRFPLAEPVPAKLIQRIAKFRAQEETARLQAKTAKRTTKKAAAR